jgi:KaiC/GvpD/RAD55 family RecA-like ATPase
LFDHVEGLELNPAQFKIKDLDTQVDPSKFVLFARNKRLGSVGNFVALTGKPKAGKSAFAHAIISAAITQSPQLEFSVQLPENRRRVVLIDTEQDQNDLAVSLNRLKKQAQIDTYKSYPNFSVYSVSTLDPGEVLNFINTLLRNEPGIGLVVIDGLLDLINDMNEVKECRQLLQQLKSWAITYQLLFVGVLHQSKSSGFSIGHLGSFADRKAQAVLSVEKNEDESSTISAQYMRSDANFEPITIYYNYNIHAYSVEFSQDKIANRNKKKKES